MQNNTVYEEIEDDQMNHQLRKYTNQNQYNQNSHQIHEHNNILLHQAKYQQEDIQYNNQTKQQGQNYLQKVVQPISSIDQIDLGKYAHFQQDNQDGEGVKISISKTQKKGGVMSSHIVYIIEGSDKKGTFCVPRRFNQFFEMRAAMVNRWPGCFIPSVPAKSVMGKTDDDVVNKRLRYLNEFVKKMAKLTHLFYGEEFQALLRAQQNDISQLFSKWPVLTSQAVINKYRVSFSDLAGKQLNYDTSEKIKQFTQFIKKNQAQLSKDRQNMKKLALANDKLKSSYGQFFTQLAPNYQKNCFLQYCDKKQTDTLYLNESQIKLQQHQTLSKQALKKNPYWVLYDTIKQQQRDGLAFLQGLQAKGKYEHKKNSIDIKISTNQKTVAQLSMGKKPLFSGSKGTSQQMKYKLQVQIQELKRQKQNVLIIIDIVTALIAYLQIQRYKQQKKRFYLKALGRISGNQITQIQNLAEVWTGLNQATNNKIHKSN